MYNNKNSLKGVYILLIVLAVIAVAISLFVNRGNFTETPGSEETPIAEVTPTPKISPTPEILTPEQEASYFESSVVDMNTDGMYSNSVLSAYSRNGGVFYVGVDDDSLSDGLYLNPHYEPSDAEILKAQEIGGNNILTYGTYVKASEYGLSYSDTDGASLDADKNMGDYNFLITGQTYDTLVPSKFQSYEQYGAKWARDPQSAEPENSATISFRVISLWDGSLVDIFHASVIYDNGQLKIESLYRADVAETGELTADERSDAVSKAIDFINSPDAGPQTTISYSDWGSLQGDIIVEKAPGPYFRKLFRANDEPAAAGNFSNCDMYAVNLPQAGAGFITVYLAPSLQLAGMLSATAPGETDKDLTVCGYDALMPFTKNSLAVPDEYAEYFFK